MYGVLLMMLLSCAANHWMLTSPKMLPRRLCSRTPWLLGTLIVMAGCTVGPPRITWYGLPPVRLNCDRMVASSSCSLVLPEESGPPAVKPGGVGTACVTALD